MLKEHGIEHTYREYTEAPLSRDELAQVFDQLGLEPAALLRTRDAKKLGVSKDLDGAALLDAMAQHPTLLQRPIGVYEGRAVVGRPIENLLELVGISPA